MTNFKIVVIGLSIGLIHSLGLFSLSTQKTNSFILLDKDTGIPITRASYTYASQQGSTDDTGKINLHYQQGHTLKLSHLNYGKWHLTDSTLVATFKTQKLYWKGVTINLYPVTVIALRPNNKPKEAIRLNYAEQLAHDGATVLNKNPVLNSIRKGGNYGFDPVFRGFKYNQLNIVLDGAQGATAACPNRMDPQLAKWLPKC